MAQRSLLAIVLLTACTSTASPATTQPESTTTVPAGRQAGRIVVDAGDAAYTVAPDGTGRADLDEAVPASQPTWSRDGTRLVWTAGSAGSPQVAVGVPGSVERLVDAPFTPFYYSRDPTSQRVAMLGNGQTGTIELAVLDTGDGSVLGMDGGAPYYFDWSPGGEEIVAHVGQASLRILGLDGTVRFSEQSEGLYQAPQWTEAAMFWQDDAPSRVTARGAGRLVQAADGQAIFFGDPSTGEREIIARPNGFSLFEMGGERLAYLDRGSGLGGSLWLAADDVPELLNDRPVLAFQWNPQSTRLAWLQLVAGDEPLAQWVVWEDGVATGFEPHRPAPGFVNRYLPFWDQYSRSLTIWSPQGDAFVYATDDPDDGPTVFIQSVDAGSAPQRIGPGEFASWGPATLTP